MHICSTIRSHAFKFNIINLRLHIRLVHAGAVDLVLSILKDTSMHHQVGKICKHLY